MNNIYYCIIILETYYWIEINMFFINKQIYNDIEISKCNNSFIY